MNFVHPVVKTLENADPAADNYQETRVKIINQHTHTIDPVIDVDSEEDEDSDEELEQFDSSMTSMLSELTKGSAKPPRGSVSRPQISDDLSVLLRVLAEAHGVLRGAGRLGVELSDEERLLVGAVVQGEAGEVARLLKVGGRAQLVVDAEGNSLLHLACRHPQDRVIASIARLRPDLNCRNLRGASPLHELAAHGGSLAILGSLVKLGALPFARNNMGQTPAQLIGGEALRSGFEKWLAAHNYFPADSAEPQLEVRPVPLFTKSGKRCLADCTVETTAGAVLEDLPLELASLRPVSQHLTLVEYRRKTETLPPKLSILPPTQLLLELTQTWGEDPQNANSIHRLLLVPGKGAPRETIEAYERGGFGQIGYKK